MRITKALGRDGFRIDSFVLDAWDYGCPQYRKRSFTIANRLGVEVAVPQPRRGVRTVREAWVGLSATPNDNNQHYAPPASDIALARMRVIPPGGDKRDVMRKAPEITPPSWWRLECAVTDAWGRMEWDKPCNTLRTGLQNASRGRYIHPDQHRVISLREGRTAPYRFAIRGHLRDCILKSRDRSEQRSAVLGTSGGKSGLAPYVMTPVHGWSALSAQSAINSLCAF